MPRYHTHELAAQESGMASMMKAREASNGMGDLSIAGYAKDYV